MVAKRVRTKSKTLTLFCALPIPPPRTPVLGAGGARIVVHTELFLSLLSSERAFSGIVDTFVHKHFSGGKPPDA